MHKQRACFERDCGSANGDLILKLSTALCLKKCVCRRNADEADTFSLERPEVEWHVGRFSLRVMRAFNTTFNLFLTVGGFSEYQRLVFKQTLVVSMSHQYELVVHTDVT